MIQSFNTKVRRQFQVFHSLPCLVGANDFIRIGIDNLLLIDRELAGPSTVTRITGKGCK